MVKLFLAAYGFVVSLLTIVACMEVACHVFTCYEPDQGRSRLMNRLMSIFAFLIGTLLIHIILKEIVNQVRSAEIRRAVYPFRCRNTFELGRYNTRPQVFVSPLLE